MDISKLSVILLLKGKEILRGKDNIVWEFYLKDGRVVLFYENGKMRGQCRIKNVIVLPIHIQNSIERFVCLLDIQELQQFLKIPAERCSYWKHSEEAI